MGCACRREPTRDISRKAAAQPPRLSSIMDLLAQLFVNGLINGSHYALLGSGFGLIFATTRIVHFAYGPIFTAAAYAAWLAANVLGLPIAAAMLFAALIAAALGTASYQYLYLPFELR